MNYEANEKYFIIGICGVTCGGKTTVATQLHKSIPNSKLFTVDDYFLDPSDTRHTWIPELNHINFDILSSLDLEQMHKDVLSYIGNSKSLKNGVKRDSLNKMNMKHVQTFIHKRVSEVKIKIIIVEGFCLFNYKPLEDLCDVKYYFLLDKEECFKRRIMRVYDPPDCPGYFEQCVWPEHEKHLAAVRDAVKDVVYLDQNSQNVVEKIFADIASYL
ncbi:unnamed protein product [Acanthoscelides obtectus]|uniref:Phosphoribulokinase/uridine kinase domain-containing protein n=1 Tax=Acanthoscelides obtectus TaxID=200917 RepID=A0A9P0LHI7_ACAOB|nr:unnamed protein product [Acanthoscelides obtectus]CAK1632691.1 Nicotinamide riboside kinase 1 [Acanthoscelides obtectus]